MQLLESSIPTPFLTQSPLEFSPLFLVGDKEVSPFPRTNDPGMLAVPSESEHQTRFPHPHINLRGLLPAPFPANVVSVSF